MSLLASLLRPPRLRPPSIAAAAVRAEERGRARYHHGNDTSRECEGRRRREGDGRKGRRNGERATRHDDVEWKRVERVFINGLVQAGSCRQCATPISHSSMRATRATFRDTPRHHQFTPLTPRRHFSTKDKHRQTAPAKATDDPQSTDDQQDTNDQQGTNDVEGADIPREKYRELADIYSFSWNQPRPPSRMPSNAPPDHLPLAPRLFLTAEQEDRPPYGHRKRQILPPIDAAHADLIEQLNKAMLIKYKHRDKAWNIYCSLPTPRPRYLEDRTIRRLFNRIALVEFKNVEACQRYFSLLDECLGEGIELTVFEWNTAISLAGRWVKDTTKEEVRTAVETWMRMEKAGYDADNVTFNILFDIALRASRFALADTIYSELNARSMPLNRYFRTSMIYYAGMRGDGDAVRQAFRDLVNSGQIVDTAVMNCVIHSLVRAGEAASAEVVFAKMKTLHATKFGTRGPRNWMERRELGIQLHHTAERLQREKDIHERSFFGGTFSSQEKKEQAQRAAPIHPDGHTCSILIRWHALSSGDLSRVRELLTEMREGEWHIHGSVYLQIFRGFWLFGGHAYTVWNRASLEAFWVDFLEALAPPPRPHTPETDGDAVNFTPFQTQDRPSAITGLQPDEMNVEEEYEDEEISNEDLPPYFTTLLAKRVIYAFYRCAGSKKMLQVWAQIQERWPEMLEAPKTELQEVVDRLVAEST